MRVLLVPMSLTVPMFAMLVSLARADREMPGRFCPFFS